MLGKVLVPSVLLEYLDKTALAKDSAQYGEGGC